MPAERFDELLITDETLAGLASAGFTTMTRIQRETLPVTLEGQDVIACAKTGSGKTLAFLIPVLDTLVNESWHTSDGLGAVILTPTRELATQIFDMLRAVGTEHGTITAGIITGGLSVADERKMIAQVSIIVATPGRLRQHLDESATLSVDNLRVLVLDEADRLLDAGFAKEMAAILDHLAASPDRQTLLFSATMGKDLKIPAALGMRDPKYISAHEASALATPFTLCQNFILSKLEDKLSLLYSFLLAHDRQKTIVFASTCNQVKFYYLALSRVLHRKGVPCACLTGKMKQHQRQEVYKTFAQRSAMVLFATDVACRGLDFPKVRWVVQFDVPDSIETYIHRVGRTARCGGKGCSLLVLTPEETDLLYHLDQAKVKLREVRVRDGEWRDVHPHLVAEVTQGLKVEAQKAFISYLRSIHLNENKKLLTLDQIDYASFARSLGLYSVPNLSKLRLGHRPLKNVPWEIKNKEIREAAAAQQTENQTAGKEEAMPLAGGERLVSRANISRSARQRSAKHLSGQMERMREMNEEEDDDAGDVLESLGSVSSEAVARPDLERISKKAKRKFDAASGVDISVAKYGLAKHQVFEDD